MKNNNQKMSALQFMKLFDETASVMESIAEETKAQHKTLMENAFALQQDELDENGQFDLGNMMDVKVSDSPEMQPRLYNQPTPELSEADKNIILDRFTELLTTIQDDVVDMKQLPAFATVIKDQYGYTQDIEKFLRDAISNAVSYNTSKNGERAQAVGAPAVDSVPGLYKFPRLTGNPDKPIHNGGIISVLNGFVPIADAVCDSATFIEVPIA